MEGEAAAIRDADELDPLALTLGSIYATAAVAVAAAPASSSPPPPLPPPPVAPRATHRCLNNGSAPIHAAAAAPASPPPVAPRATCRRLNNGSAPIHAAAAAPASPPPVAPRATCRRLNNGSAPIHAAAAAPASPPPPPPPPAAPRAIHGRANRAVRRRPRAENAGDLVEAPFPWATERPAQHGTLRSLLRRGVTSVEGQARCKRCGARKAIAYDLEAKFWEVRDYIVTNRHVMYDRAPKAWEFPALPDCGACGHKGAMWPEIANDKHEINWLFLFLGQMLGCCTLEQLKFFCMNNRRHRTGAKNRVLYYAYIEMSNQLLSFD